MTPELASKANAGVVDDRLHRRIHFAGSAFSCRRCGGGLPAGRPIVGPLITVAILAVLRTAARATFRWLMDAAETALAAEPAVTGVRSVKIRWIGHRSHADAELDIDPASSVTDAHRIAHDAEHTLAHAVPKLSSPLIHAYPASHPWTHAP